MPPSCLHHGNDIYKWRSTSHRHGVAGSRSTPACGGDGNNTEVSPVPRLSSEPCPEPAALDSPRWGLPEGTRAGLQGGEAGERRAAAVPPFGPAVAELLAGELIRRRLPLGVSSEKPAPLAGAAASSAAGGEVGRASPVGGCAHPSVAERVGAGAACVSVSVCLRAGACLCLRVPFSPCVTPPSPALSPACLCVCVSLCVRGERSAEPGAAAAAAAQRRGAPSPAAGGGTAPGAPRSRRASAAAPRRNRRMAAGGGR